MHGGHASDKFITSDAEDLLLNLESSKGSVMADRVFFLNDWLIFWCLMSLLAIFQQYHGNQY